MFTSATECITVTVLGAWDGRYDEHATGPFRYADGEYLDESVFMRNAIPADIRFVFENNERGQNMRIMEGLLHGEIPRGKIIVVQYLTLCDISH